MAAANEIWGLTILGDPQGEFEITITLNGTEDDITIPWNASAAAVKSAIEGHSGYPEGTGHVTVRGGALPGRAIGIEFTGGLGSRELPMPIVDHSGLTGDGEYCAIISRWQKGSSS